MKLVKNAAGRLVPTKINKLKQLPTKELENISLQEIRLNLQSEAVLIIRTMEIKL
jgi:hypothetical protein